MKKNKLKIIRVLLFINLTLFTFNSTLQASSIYEKLKLGMSVKEFNQLHLGLYLLGQKLDSLLTNFGIVKKGFESKGEYIDLNNRVWKGLLIKIKDNKIESYALHSKSIEDNDIKILFNDLTRLLGNNFSIKEFSFFYKKGHGIIWSNHSQETRLKIFKESNETFVVLEKNKLDRKPIYSTPTKEHIGALTPILGEGFSQLFSNAAVITVNDTDR